MSSYCVKCGSVLNNYECPICGAKYRAKTVYTPPPYGLMPDTTPDKIISTLRMHEIICSIVWLILGIIQIFLLVSSVMGICNIVYALVNGFIKIKYMLKPYEHDTYKYYKDKMPIIIISIVSNIFLGAVIGIIGGIYELYIRNYVLKNKFAFNKI